MNAALLLAHFDRVSEAPDAIARLRRFILDLAVRGKLVEQDPADEPASELLKRIQAEKARLVSAGDIKKQDALPPVSEDELSFEVPPGWYPTRLAVVALCLDYMREPVNSTMREQRIAGKNVSELFPYFGATQQQGWIDDYIFDEELVLLGEDGVPFFDKLRPKAYVISGKTWVNNHAHVFRGIMVSHAFLAHCLNTFDYTGRFVGATRSKLNQSKAIDIPIILPPLAEQHRIVAKVDELMALCDRLEAAQVKRESQRDRLAAASLQRLNQPADAPSFREYARFHLRHLPRLTTRPEHIQQLRQIILNLAVRGRLVPQDPDDEPASKLLNRIQVEKARLIRKGKTKEQKASRASTDAGEPFDIPENWRWVSLGEIVSGFRYGTSVRCAYEPTGEPVLRIPNMDNGRINIDDLKFGPLSAREADDLRLQLGDILMVRSNGSLNLVGRPALVEAHAVGYCYAGYLVRVRTSSSHLDARYLVLALNTAHVRYQIEFPIRTTVGLKNVNATELSGLTIPLPLLAQQHRIVAKVDELVALCDRLEAQLNAAQTESHRFLEAVLHEALATAG